MARRYESFAVDVVIADGASLSSELMLDGAHLTAIFLPSGWDTNIISFAAAPEPGGTFVPCYDGSGELQIPNTAAVASRCVCLAAGTFAGQRVLKIRSGLSGAAANQAGAVTLTCILTVYS